jgi:Sec-independent protein translocase protein TatA
MFGLGPGEIAILVAIVALIGGPAAVKKLARAFQTAQKAKSELTGKALLGKILDEDESPPKKKKRKKRKKGKRASAKRTS